MRLTYFVFHGVTRTADSWANTTVIGYGKDRSSALADAVRRERGRYRGRYGERFRSFGQVEHVSGPHRA